MKFLPALFLACLMFALPTQSVAQTDYSGSWYNPSRNGEGFHIQLLDNGQALVIWFTYPGVSDDPATEQSWILGIGEFSGNTITINDAFKANGPVFGDGYDKDDFNRIIWGDLSVTFSGAATGVVNYDGLDGAGSTNISRITSIVGTEVKSSLPDGVSGAWYDPETDGQGWFVDRRSTQ